MAIGIFWVLFAAILLGFYALPSKFVKNYPEENLWGTFWLLAMFVIPILTAFLLVNGLREIYAQVPVQIFIWILLLSILWGVGNILWGKCISTIGLALGFSLLIGITTLLGSILPFFLGGSEKLSTTGGLTILLGVLIILVGIVANGKAGLLREEARTNTAVRDETAGKNMRQGILMSIVGGICATGFNLAYHVSDTLGKIGSMASEQFGNPAWIARLAVMLPAFMGSGLVTVLYFIIQLNKQKGWAKFIQQGSSVNLFLIGLMAVVYCASLILYGLGAFHLGILGNSVGFAIFQAGCIMVANLLGLITGEWKGVPAKSRTWLISGLLLMSIGIIVIGFGNSLI